ncbi:MAG TPA: hypothetical protein VFR21_11215 [Bradyrhizobium sp.]|nr:hypothetical protein [Bradyrhizobium sp.]
MPIASASTSSWGHAIGRSLDSRQAGRIANAYAAARRGWMTCRAMKGAAVGGVAGAAEKHHSKKKIEKEGHN